jgi:SP family general alpha glucoside:H+ symporter-like MFS transporter
MVINPAYSLSNTASTRASSLQHLPLNLKMAEKDLQQPMATQLVAPNEEAQHAADDEKSMTLVQAIKLYPKAVGWSVVLSSALIMEGYDLALLGSLYGSPQFNRKYGVFNAATGKYSVQASWQSAL